MFGILFTCLFERIVKSLLYSEKKTKQNIDLLIYLTLLKILQHLSNNIEFLI